MRRPQSRPRLSNQLPKAPEVRHTKADSPKRAANPKPKQVSKTREGRPKFASVINLSTRRHRTRRIVFSVGAFVVVAIVTVMSIAVFSPALAITKIQVVGANRVSEKSIENALQAQIGIPLTRVDNAKVAAQLQSFSLIESVSVVASPPHTLLVKVTERSPIAIVYLGGQATLVDPAGIQIGPAANSDHLPVVDVVSDPRGNSNYRAAVDVLLALPSELYPQVASISARSKDDVTLQLRGVANQQIVWGDGSQSALKSKVLQALFKNTKRNVELTIDVSSPETPVVRY